ncbi:hypothetical protein EVAR_66625_1 [Eumeta japonica]|uniref:Uncharacterized protein n=1 Tax=Eumeta variegata TaxID=151549 RepID=A0A4C1ZVG2_EUMVA|nr:hypothetical protein EVAR_66625_1 [Eumeta japonica]
MPEWKGRVPLTRSHCERITYACISTYGRQGRRRHGEDNLPSEANLSETVEEAFRLRAAESEGVSVEAMKSAFRQHGRYNGVGRTID